MSGKLSIILTDEVAPPAVLIRAGMGILPSSIFSRGERGGLLDAISPACAPSGVGVAEQGCGEGGQVVFVVIVEFDSAGGFSVAAHDAHLAL
jgi:hypothetical protein